uniref:Uncharacterized protein n=1 Tax=Brassica campestris TaxID=3711 RepID=A0A3P5YJS5_BRACM|nr:unnamed protein product [Brassica rapa]
MVDARCNTCSNPTRFNFCWFHSEGRLCVMSRNDSADYAWNQEGHLHSPSAVSADLNRL